MSSPEFREELPGEVETWQREGLVHADQAQRILARYGLVAGETSDSLHQSKLVSILAILGVLLIGVGVILFVGANWQSMPKLGRLALLLVSTAAMYFSGYRMAHQSQKYPKIGQALLFLGSLLWGASIFLVAQMYSLGGEGGERTAVLWWIIGVIPLAYILESQPHMIMSVVLATIWFGMTISFGSQTAFVALLVWGVFLYALGRMHTIWPAVKSLNKSYNWLGLLSILTVLYAFSFRDFWQIGWWYENASNTSSLIVLFVLAGLSSIALFVLQMKKGRVALFESLALFLLLGLGAGTLMWFTQASNSAHPGAYESWHHVSLLSFAIFNLVLLASEIGVIALGWFRNLPGLANLGIAVFFIQLVTRYFDLLGGMLQGGLMFIGAGIVLFLGGFLLERYRRKLLYAMSERRVA